MSKKKLLSPLFLLSGGIAIGVTYAFARKYISDRYLDADNMSQYVSCDSKDAEFISEEIV